nr:DNA polymerase III subunit chi [Gammaproteobacteria bacterium]
MDTPKPPITPSHLLDDLESIRQLLDEEGLEPPLLTEQIDTDDIPLLSEVIEPDPQAAPAAPAPEAGLPDREHQRLESELRAAAQLILQDVIDDFVPQIEAELKRRLEARLGRLLAARRS